MRKIVSSLLAVGLFLSVATQPGPANAQEELEGTITFSGAWALYPMVVKWAEEFQKVYPDVRIDVAAGGAGKGMADALASVVDIGNVSRDIYPEEIKKGAWFVAVTKDAVVPTFNENNPFKDVILSKGMKREDFIGIWMNGDMTDWKDAVSGESKVPGKTGLHVYTRSDACGAAKTWAKYLGKDQEDLLGIGVYGDPGLAEAVRKDVLGIGFNNINYVYDPQTKIQVKGIKVLPVDLNANGTIDEDEDFYESRDGITEAIAAGKYPSPPARDLYFVSHGRPQREVVIKFMRWVLTEGQKYVAEAGYIPLNSGKLREGLEKLESP